MAKGCTSYAIETDEGRGWETKHRFRALEQDLEMAFNHHCSLIPEGISVRLARVHVLHQRNRVLASGTQKMP